MPSETPFQNFDSMKSWQRLFVVETSHWKIRKTRFQTWSTTISVPFNLSGYSSGHWDFIYKVRLLDSISSMFFSWFMAGGGVESGVNVIIKCIKKNIWNAYLLLWLYPHFFKLHIFFSFLKLLCIYNKLLLYHIFTLSYPQSFEIKLPCQLQQSGSSNEGILLFVMILHFICHKRTFSYNKTFWLGLFIVLEYNPYDT